MLKNRLEKLNLWIKIWEELFEYFVENVCNIYVLLFQSKSLADYTETFTSTIKYYVWMDWWLNTNAELCAKIDRRVYVLHFHYKFMAIVHSVSVITTSVQLHICYIYILISIVMALKTRKSFQISFTLLRKIFILEIVSTMVIMCRDW